MNDSAKQEFIQANAIEHKIKWSSHALAELTPEGLSVPEVEQALQYAQVIEDYPHAHRYLPDCLAMAFIAPGEPVHVVVALNDTENYILVVTVYRPTSQEWHNDWRTRK